LNERAIHVEKKKKKNKKLKKKTYLEIKISKEGFKKILYGVENIRRR